MVTDKDEDGQPNYPADRIIPLHSPPLKVEGDHLSSLNEGPFRLPSVLAESRAFPMSALPEVVRELVVAEAANAQVDEALCAAAALAAISGAVGSAAVVVDAVAGKTTPANLFVVAGAPRSYGKGSAQFVAHPIMEADQAGGPEGPRLWTGNFTSAGLLPLLSESGGQIFSFSTEAADAVRIPLGKFDRNGRGDLDLLLAAYSNEYYGSTRAGSGTQRIRPCLSVFWAAQPSIVRELYASPQAMDRGMIARFLPVMLEPSTIPKEEGARHTVAESVRSNWSSCIHGLLRLRTLPDAHRLQADDEATECFRAFHNEVVEFRNGAFRDVEGELGRWRENAVRIALGLALAEWADSPDSVPALTVEHARRGIEIMRFFGRQQLLLLHSGRMEAYAARGERLAMVLRSKGGAVSLGTLLDAHGFPDHEVRRLVQGSPHRFHLEHMNAGKPGRPHLVARLIS